MATRPLPAQDVLLQLLSYDPETGDLRWKERDPSFFRDALSRTAEHTAKIWNLRYAGKFALHSITSEGYRAGHLMGMHVKAHRAIWKMLTGTDAEQVDHINGVRSDNRELNLRNTDQSQNQRNARRRKDNSSGVVGVTWYPHERVTGRWLVKVGNKHLGMFENFDEAVAARKAAEVQHGFHPNHGRN